MKLKWGKNSTHIGVFALFCISISTNYAIEKKILHKAFGNAQQTSYLCTEF